MHAVRHSTLDHRVTRIVHADTPRLPGSVPQSVLLPLCATRSRDRLRLAGYLCGCLGCLSLLECIGCGLCFEGARCDALIELTFAGLSEV